MTVTPTRPASESESDSEPASLSDSEELTRFNGHGNLNTDGVTGDSCARPRAGRRRTR